MTMKQSRQHERFHQARQNASNKGEPPTLRSLPAMEVADGSEDIWWGHTMGEKQQGTIRFMLQNVDGIPMHEDRNIKLN